MKSSTCRTRWSRIPNSEAIVGRIRSTVMIYEVHYNKGQVLDR